MAEVDFLGTTPSCLPHQCSSVKRLCFTEHSSFAIYGVQNHSNHYRLSEVDSMTCTEEGMLLMYVPAKMLSVWTVV